MSATTRPALGEQYQIGALYNARKDCFLPTSAFVNGVPSDASRVEWQEGKKLSLCDSSDYKARLNLTSVTESLAASCIAGWLTLKGSGEFLKPLQPSKTDDVYYAMNFSRSTISQELRLEKEGVLEAIENATLNRESATTHVVTQVLWGASCTVTAAGSIQDDAQRQDIAESFQEALRKLAKFSGSELELRTLLKITDDVLNPGLSLCTYSDLLTPQSPSPATLPDIKSHLERIFDLADLGYAEAQPLTYVLTPVESLFKQHSSAPLSFDTIGQLKTEQFEKALGLFDSYGTAHCLLQDSYQRLKKNRMAVQADHREEVRDALEEIVAAKSRFETEFSALLTSIRNGQARNVRVDAFLHDFSTGPSSPAQLLSIMDKTSGKLDVIDTVNHGGGRCINAGSPEEQALGNCFALYFSEEAMQHSAWQPNFDLFKQLLADQTTDVVAIDCDGGGRQLEGPRVAKYKNGKCKVADIVGHRKAEAALSFIRFDPGSIDSSVKDAPSQRKPVKIPCPDQVNCGSEARDWVCEKCRVKVEFGVVDSYLYCECGRTSLSSPSFNCQQGHGEQYTRYPPQYLQKLLKGLPIPPETNVLILGETGVGKSTFINSFINYLSFEKLDDALAAKHLNWIIPCSFATQNVAPDGRLIQKQVRIGEDADEADSSKGDSATQQATVYPVYYGDGLVRLIDTPGIGDTRGPDQDRQNMINILRVLRNYEKLHGILILLKPNNARLTIMFKFCIKELLTQLHRTAAENMVFGFTNTRGSNYQPGDTFQPLEHLLKEYNDVIRGLFKDTVYCFDSESFRYLAARHKGIDMGHIDDYRRSWDHSAGEARRMVSYFQNRIPHEVRSTVSLNETRYLITQLIQPMAQISTAIADTVKQSEDKIKDLQNTNVTGEQLKAKLKMTMTVIESVQLSRPRTVCSNSECCSLSSGDNNMGTQVTLFKSRCHDPCGLTNVPPDIVGTKELPPCTAFGGGTSINCLVCGHHWQEHQHVVVEYVERTKETTDPVVQDALRHNGNEASAKQLQINALQKLINELQGEHRLIQESQARFSHYLQQHSITHYNDATIEYFEHLIKDERSKVSRGAPRTRLEQLEADKSSYEYFVTAMKRGKQSKGQGGALDERGVYSLVKQLYQMKHYGKNLKDCAKKTGQAYSATFRERPYRVRNRGGRSAGISGMLASIISNVASPHLASQGSGSIPSQAAQRAFYTATAGKSALSQAPSRKTIQRPAQKESRPRSHTVDTWSSSDEDRAQPSPSQPRPFSSSPTAGYGTTSTSKGELDERPAKTLPVASIPAAITSFDTDSDDEVPNTHHTTDSARRPPEIITQSTAGGPGVRNRFWDDDDDDPAMGSPPPPSLTSQQSTLASPSSSVQTPPDGSQMRWKLRKAAPSPQGSTVQPAQSSQPSYRGWDAGTPPQFGNPNAVLGHGVVPVMLHPGRPSAPYGQHDLKRMGSKWLSNVKKKVTGKG